MITKYAVKHIATNHLLSNDGQLTAQPEEAKLFDTKDQANKVVVEGCRVVEIEIVYHVWEILS